jgi:glycosyltransferase involved in cell wall biosynthesis
VLLVGPSLDILGGQAVQARRLYEGLQGSDHVDVGFLAVNPRLPGPLGRLQQIKFVRTIVTSIAYVGSLLRAARRYDVVHAFSASYFSYLLAPLPAMVIARMFGRATVLNYRSGEARDHLTRWRATAVPTMRRFATRIVVPSGYLVDVFRDFGLPAQSISNFVPIESLPYRRRTALAPVFFSNRNLEALYNVGCTIRAFAAVQAEYPDASLTLAGDGAMRQELEALVASLSLRNVRFIGRVAPSEMGRLYDAADIYLNSPDIDNMPGSIIEAFACGIPVVTTDAGGIPYVVTHERTGLMVPRDDARGMADAAIRLLRDDALALRIGDEARAECQRRYVWPAVRREWEQLYTGLHAARSKAAIGAVARA